MIQPGLERISLLLKDSKFPWKSIHVAGTNGKGSICAHASRLLASRSVRVGTFTSPHLVHRWDCIQINGAPVHPTFFKRIEGQINSINRQNDIKASEFELLTATAFHIFNEAKIDVGVVEVGMGGRFDATNVLNNQVVSVISKIARDHEAFLGSTIEEITRHKAGILRPNIPYLVNPSNEWNVHQVIQDVAEEIGAGPIIHSDTPELDMVWNSAIWIKYTRNLLPFQLDNLVLAYLAAVEAFKSLGYGDETWRVQKLVPALTSHSSPLPGRLQKITVPLIFGPSKKILIDGAHNNDSAKSLRQWVDKFTRRDEAEGANNVQPPADGWPVTWVVAMSDTKDIESLLVPLLRDGDTIVTTSFGPVDGMPWVRSMDPEKIRTAAKRLHSNMAAFAMPKPGVHRALIAAKLLSPKNNPIILAGSLYLVGEFLRERNHDTNIDVAALRKEEQERIGQAFTPGTYPEEDVNSKDVERANIEETEPTMEDPSNPDLTELEELQEEMRRLNQQLAQLESESRGSISQKETKGRPFVSRQALQAGKRHRVDKSSNRNIRQISEDLDKVRKSLDDFLVSSPRR
ncbi:Mur ligase [Dendryphion nanum]|uniref:Mur ligase n=1 Tax=Dendryphion nanum TaxID=256645 RepID=A0A9P9D7I5_9PLEO|nr:Mur ligase [Dendryphion nanum]